MVICLTTVTLTLLTEPEEKNQRIQAPCKHKWIYFLHLDFNEERVRSVFQFERQLFNLHSKNDPDKLSMQFQAIINNSSLHK